MSDTSYTITFDPTVLQLRQGGTPYQLVADVSPSAVVTWSFAPGGDTGTLSSSGLYTPPAEDFDGQEVYFASILCSVGSSRAMTTIALANIPTLPVTPSGVSLHAGETMAFSIDSAEVQEVDVWDTSLENLGSLSSDGTYTAPATVPYPMTIYVVAYATGTSGEYCVGLAVVTLLP